MSFLTISSIALIAFGLVSRRYGHALALGGATSAGVAVAVGATVVPTFYAVALGFAVMLAARFLARRKVPEPLRVSVLPGVPLLLVFLAWATLVTFVAPLLFDGTQLVTPVASRLTAGSVSTSNLAQLVYVALGIAVIVLLARSPDATPAIIGLSVGVALVLSLWRYFAQYTGIPFPQGVFDNSPSLSFIEMAPGGVLRFRGIFSEPSSLAGVALVAVAYGFSRLVRTRGFRRLATVLLIALALFLGFISTSTTFIIAIIALAAIAAVTAMLGFLMRRTRFNAALAVIGCALAIVAVWVLPAVNAFVSTTIASKSGSASYDQRSNADVQSYGIFLHTWGMGVGLGSDRASSFFATLLSTTGLIGTLLFAAALVAIVFRAAPLQQYRPALWGLVALLIGKIIAGPDLSDPTGLLWMSLGVLAHGIVAPTDGDGLAAQGRWLPNVRSRARREPSRSGLSTSV